MSGRLPERSQRCPASAAACLSRVVMQDLGVIERLAARQIAEQLFISTKTASVYATNLLAKLGSTAAWRRLGLEQPELER